MERKINKEESTELKLKEIADYILQKLGDKVSNKEQNLKCDGVYIIATNGKVYCLDEYEDLIEEEPSIPQAFIFVANFWYFYEPGLDCPFIGEYDFLVDLFLRKYYYKTHFNDLKYISFIIHFTKTGETFMEVADFEIVERNTNLRKLLQMLNEVEDEDLWEKVDEFEQWFERQKLFNGYDFLEAYEIIDMYYTRNDNSLADKVDAIKKAYKEVFQAYSITLSPK
jgi:hypothetical protein